MTEQDIKARAKLIEEKEQIASAIVVMARTDTVDIRVNYNGTSSLRVCRESFLRFLQGEIQALNLELLKLGVELPEVPTIGKQQALTKGHDQ
mgnify:CR=1 FL=1